MQEFVCGAVGFLACGFAFFAGMRYGARDRPEKQPTAAMDQEAQRRAAKEQRYRENFYSYTGSPQNTVE